MGIIIHRLTQDSIKKNIQNNPSDSFNLDPKDILTHIISTFDTRFFKVINYNENKQLYIA